LLLQTLGSPLSETKGERASVYLTNALTGWEPPKEPKQHLMFPELEEERNSADEVKQSKPILVILGNPPYNAFAGVSPLEEHGLVEPYKEGLISEWKIKKFNLDDLYVRFFRLAERRIAEKTGRGVVSFISNHSWVSDPSFVVLRKHLLESFDKFWIENMHGNRKISEYAPDGKTSETIFAIPGFSAGIQQGVAISLWVKTEKKQKTQVYFRDDLNAARAEERRKQLLGSLTQKNFDKRYEKANPNKLDRFSFRPSNVASQYMEWPSLKDFCSSDPSNGLMEKRGGALINMDRSELEERMKMYFDTKVSWETLSTLDTGLTKEASGFNPKVVRKKVQNEEGFQALNLRKYAIRPFETRWCYYSSVSPLWNRNRAVLWNQLQNANSFLMTRPAGVASPEGVPIYFTRLLGDNDFLRGHAYYFPIRLNTGTDKVINKNKDQIELLDVKPSDPELSANLSAQARAYLAKLGIANPDADAETAGLIWMHALAIGYSPLYLKENADGIRQDWPRIPVPETKKQLLRSAALGKQVAALLDTEHPVAGVISGANRPEIKTIGSVSKIRGSALNPDSGDIAITAGWGHAGKEGVTMPGKGKLVERDYTPEEIKAIKEGAKSLGLSFDTALKQLGETTCDVYLNEGAFWKNVPINVWEYYIGGYQVMKKWLSYREKELLKRSLTIDEAREVTNMARRLAAIVLMQPELDRNYGEVKLHNHNW
jgi:hypothetical protein